MRFVLPTLAQLDEINCEALTIPFFADERPLRGALGLIDWRLCGLISRMIIRKRIRGTLKETVLVPGRPRLGMDKLFLFGLGPESAFRENLIEEIAEHALRTLTRAQVRTSAMILPGRASARIGPERALELFLPVAARHPEHDEVVVVETAQGQKAMAAVLERERRRARAYLE